MIGQKGGAVRYTVPATLDTPDKVLALIRERAVNLPIPSQTVGTCALDSMISALLYPSGVSDVVWRYIFEQYMSRDALNRLVVFVPDEYLSFAALRVLPEEERMNRQVDAFLASSAARVLRILENIDGSSRALRRELSFSPTPEMHGSTPSVLCATLATALGREGQEFIIYRSIEGRPPARDEADLALDAKEAGIALSKVLMRIQSREIRIQTNEDPIPERRRIAAVFISTTDTDDRVWYTSNKKTLLHAVALIQIRGSWYVADDNFGRLLKLNSGSPLSNRIIQGAFLQLHIRTISNEDRAAHGIPEEAYPLVCQYSLISVDDWKKVIATTDETFKLRLPDDDALFQMFSTAPVGAEGMRREITALADGMPINPRAMYDYYRTLEVDEDEAEDDLRDTEEVKRADIERGKAFLSKRGFSVVQRDTDINTIRRIGKNLVRWLRVSVDPTMRRTNRVYLVTPVPPPAGPAAAGAYGGKRYSRRSKQWGSKKGAGSSTRRRGLRVRRR
jgi:hypothetical protein